MPFFWRTEPGGRSASCVLKGLESVSLSMTRKLGIAAARCTLAVSQMISLPLRRPLYRLHLRGRRQSAAAAAFLDLLAGGVGPSRTAR